MTITADTELDLFSQAMAIARRNTRTGDPDTSLRAAAGVNPPASEIAVLRVLAATNKPMADHEIHKSIDTSPDQFAAGVRYSPSRVRTARLELAKPQVGYVEEVEGNLVDTPYTPKGARTWKITTAGRLHLMDNA